MNDTIQLTGTYTLESFGRLDTWYKRLAFKVISYFDDNYGAAFLRKHAVLKESTFVKNIITSAGKAQLALLTGDSTAVPFTYIALGTSATTPVVGDTTLTAEIVDSGLERVAGTVSRVTTTTTNDTYRITKTYSVTGTKSVEEIGIFNAASSGTMLSHALTTTRPLLNGDTFVATYNLQFS